MKRSIWLIGPALLLTIALAPAFAGPKASPSGSLSLGSDGSSRASSTTFAKGDRVEMTARYSGVRKQDTVRVQILCLLDIGVVYGDAVTLSGSPQTVAFTLGENSSTATSVWSSGGASCRADLYYLSNVGGSNAYYLSTVKFDATAS